MRYANWDAVVEEFDRLADDECAHHPTLAAWVRREGPREVSRLMDTQRIDDAGVLLRWRVSASEFEQHGSPSMSPSWGFYFKTIQRDRPARQVILAQTREEPGCFVWHVTTVVQEMGLVADWYRCVVANARVDLPVAEFAALPDEARVVAMTARRALRQLPHLSFAEAKAASDAWHQEEAERQRQYQANDAHRVFAVAFGLHDVVQSVPLTPAVGEGERHPVEALLGHYWCRLETEDAYRQESARMSHCVGWASQEYAERYLGKPMPSGIWSLRHVGGDVSLLTAEVDVHLLTTLDALIARLAGAGGESTSLDTYETRVVQVRAAHNHPVPPSLAPAVRWLEAMRVAPQGIWRSA